MYKEKGYKDFFIYSYIMKRNKIYKINNKEYKTQQAVLEYFKNIKDKYSEYTYLKKTNIEEYNDVNEYFKFHHEYEEKAQDMIDIMIKKDNMGWNAYFIVKSNQELISISYKHPIKCYNKKIDYIEKKDIEFNFKQALVNSIEKQKIDFRKKNDERFCALCKSEDKLEVDHIYHLNKIIKDFLEQTNLETPTIFDNHKKLNSAIFRNEDKLYEESFKKYHLEHATLRYLCKSCNVKRAKN
jgi:hypothetical protein